MADITLPPKCAFLFDKTLRYKVLRGGRGSGKSWAAARTLLILAAQEKTRVLCCRELQNSISDSVLRLLADQISAMGLDSFFDVQRDRIIGKNGSEFFFAGLRNDPQRVKSTEGVDVCWIEEAQSVSQESLDILLPTIRKPGSQVWFVFNPRYEEDAVYQMFCVKEPPPGSKVVEMNYVDNPFFPEVLLPQVEHMRVTNPLLYESVWLGKCVPSLSTALWSWDDIDKNRLPVGTSVDFARVVVSVDPAVTANKKSDETGIVVCASGRGNPRHYYTLADLSGRLSPEAWATRALQAMDTFEADAIVYETNQGGDMVAETLRGVCRTQGRAVPRLVPVRATRGKAVRAEPIAALYSQGVVHHIGAQPELERQLLRFDPNNPNQKSPDRMDALVWGLTELSSSRTPMRIAQGVVAKLSGR